MPRVVREAECVWEGNLARGEGRISALSSLAFSELPYTLPGRVGERAEGKTSPEELLAAAHAGCFAMSLAAELAGVGTPPERLDVRCAITMDEVEDRHLVVGSSIEVRATAPGATPESLAGAAEAADKGCPFSHLIRASAAVEIRATLEPS